ncbi:hypothetical protein Goklo_026276 [Gossypium klotzschianum]|uniref:SPX domain-containing protein n=1 Tax=Gossypium klotzschianum TaxID=34286 RepID=A0A7J8TUI5_9ROSI|nr:hypothetical protein [Gossypium klotzschianum]
MKFGKEFASQMVPEWQAAYMDYACLKILLKQIQHWKQKTTQPNTLPCLPRALTLYRAFSGSDKYETTFLMAAEEGGECEQQFFRRLDNELNKVDKFYRSKVKEVMEEAHTLNKQTDAFFSFRIKVDKVAAKFDHIHPSPKIFRLSAGMVAINVFNGEVQSNDSIEDNEKHINVRTKKSKCETLTET